MNLLRDVIPGIIAVVGIIIVLAILIIAVWVYLIKPMLEDSKNKELKKKKGKTEVVDAEIVEYKK